MGRIMEDIQGLSSLRDGVITLNNMPMPPSENHSYPTGKHGRRFKSKALTDFQKLFSLCFSASGDDVPKFKELVQSWVTNNIRMYVTIGFYFKEERILTKDGRSKRLDTTNRLKAVCDSLAESLGVDDKEFWVVTAHKNVSQASFDYCDIRVVGIQFIDSDTHV